MTEMLNSYVEALMSVLLPLCIALTLSFIIGFLTFIPCGILLLLTDMKISNRRIFKYFAWSWVIVLTAPTTAYFGIRTYIHFHDLGKKEHLRLYKSTTRVERFVVVSRNPPKHLYVTLRSLPSGTVFHDVYVSKHCNNHMLTPDGTEVNIKVHEQWEGESGNDRVTVFEDLPEVFECF